MQFRRMRIRWRVLQLEVVLFSMNTGIMSHSNPVIPTNGRDLVTTNKRILFPAEMTINEPVPGHRTGSFGIIGYF